MSNTTNLGEREIKTHVAKAKCLSCKKVFLSKHGGDFKYCPCGKSFIDQERFCALYVRLSGRAKLISRICPSTCKLEEHQ